LYTDVLLMDAAAISVSARVPIFQQEPRLAGVRFPNSSVVLWTNDSAFFGEQPGCAVDPRPGAPQPGRGGGEENGELFWHSRGGGILGPRGGGRRRSHLGRLNTCQDERHLENCSIQGAYPSSTFKPSMN